MTLEHKTSHKHHIHFCSNSQKYIVWVKIINIYFMPKIIRVLSKDQVPLKLNFLLVICIAKNLIWTTLNVIFSMFRFFFSTLRFQISSCISATVNWWTGVVWITCVLLWCFYHPNKPYINGKIIYSAFRWCINLNNKKENGPLWLFCGPGSHMIFKSWSDNIYLFVRIFITQYFK